MVSFGHQGDGDALVIGLVNNMPPTALRQTEHQFTRLLQEASPGRTVRLRCFAPWRLVDAHYESLHALWASTLDGLIVTGAEPRAECMTDEPLWPVLAELTDWAAANTGGALFSCLAAQAAVYRLSGVTRRPLPAKLSGVYPCSRASPHVWTQGAPAQWPVPHSRYNDIPRPDLERAGYRVLSTGPAFGEQDGADSFTITAGRSQFLLLQGHPEYGADSLLREYRRDIRRFLHGERLDWPELPRRYFDDDTEAALRTLQEGCHGWPASQVMAAFADRVTAVPEPRWHERSVAMMSAWLGSLQGARAQAGQGLVMAAS